MGCSLSVFREEASALTAKRVEAAQSNKTEKSDPMKKVAVDLGYRYVKTVSSTGKRALFPSLLEKAYERGMSSLFGQDIDALSNMHIYFEGEDYFVGELAKESRSASRIFKRERFSHMYTHILLNSAIQAITYGSVERIQ